MANYNLKEYMNKPERLAPGHRMCVGCGATIGVRAVLRALKEKRPGGYRKCDRMSGSIIIYVSIQCMGGQLYT